MRLFIRNQLLEREINDFKTPYVCIVWDAISKIEENTFGPNYLNKYINSDTSYLNKEFFDLDLISLLPDLGVLDPNMILYFIEF